MTEVSQTGTEPAVEDKSSVKYLVTHASGNPAELVWPTDPHGIVPDLRQALLTAAGRVQGFSDKQELLLNTLFVGIAHIKARFEKDRKHRDTLAKWSEDLLATRAAQHIYGEQE